VKNRIIFLVLIVFALIFIGIYLFRQPKIDNTDFIVYEPDLHKQDLKMYWKNDKNELYKSIENLKNGIETKGKKLVFAMNGGMYKPENAPQGLYIEAGNTMMDLDTTQGKGNFYLKPNGVFFITQNKIAYICTTEDFKTDENIKYATQSGPLLLLNGNINGQFNKGSNNLNIRNGVGILPNGNILFVMSKKEINFYNFALIFKEKGCKNALYLDGFVSRTYLPEKNWVQIDGDFGVIIGVVE
jgi:uncharacterized protein YigE (DUF2233 family)